MLKRDIKKIKCEEAILRNEKWNSLSTKQKIKKLDNRLGKGVGAIKQRKRLEEL